MARLFSPDKFVLTIIQQPPGVPEFVSRMLGTVTRFQSAKCPAYLAHNFASGKEFFRLKISDAVQVIDGEVTESYQVTEIRKYQATRPDDPRSEFIENPPNPLHEGGQNGEHLTAAELFEEIYSRPERLVLQTCIGKGDEDSWGRLFVICLPKLTPHSGKNTQSASSLTSPRGGEGYGGS